MDISLMTLMELWIVFRKFTESSKIMSALSVLYVILPVLVVSLFHTLEVAFTARWRVGRRSGINANAFLIAAGAGFLMLLLVTAALFVGGLWAERVWATVFMAYSMCTLISIVRAVVLKCYVPGLVTNIVSVPLISYAAYSLSLVWPWWEMLLFAVIGLALAVAGLFIAHRIGQHLSH